MLTLWYIILGWKEYNKSFRNAEEPPKQVDPAKKPDLIPQKKDVPKPPQDINKSEPSKSIPIDPKSSTRQPEPSFFYNKKPEVPEIPDKKFNLPTPTTPEVPKSPETPKVPEPPKQIPKTPETPKIPEVPKVEAPKIPPRTPETPKMPDFKLAPEVPKKPESPKTPDPPSVVPRTPQTPKTPEGIMPSRRPESTMPDFPPSRGVPTPVQSEFPIPPYLPGAPGSNKPPSKDDELFALTNTFNSPSPNRPSGNLRDLSYAKGEFPGEVAEKVQENLSKIPKYMEQSVISNPDSLESEEEDESF